MAKYIKHNSNYIKTVRHQFLKDGSTIFERDWVTVGSQLNFGPGKIPYYDNGNFIFTTSLIPRYQKRYKNGVTVATWTYEDVKDATSVVNQIRLDEHSEDMRSYAYYGSCVELVRASIENIINTFPGNITLTTDRLPIPPETEGGEYTYIEGHIVNNPFQIDLYTKDVILGPYDNELRFLSYSWDKYTINGQPIRSYTISDWLGDLECPQNDQYFIKKAPVITVTINGIVLKGYKYENDIVFCCNRSIVIQPKEEIIEEYFNNLEGFEKQLLTRKTNPQFTNNFITPIEYNLGFLYYKRTYTWPSNGYCIDITSPRYIDFVTRLRNTAELLDELWTDNLWRRMTHEAIKNYDWTYTREFEEGEEQDNVDGGERMHKVLNVIGRVFDDVKRTIDVVKRNNKVGYGGDRNVANALLSDKLEIKGWDIYSTIWSYDNGNGEIVSASQDTLQDVENWYPTLDPTKMSFADVDIEFMRRLILSTRRIWETKGTRHGIDMIMGMFGYGNMDENCYDITEEYYVTIPKKYDDEIGNGESFGDRIVRINRKKGSDFLYDEDASGIPVASFIGDYDNEGKPITYLIPFYNQNKFYDGDFCFQSRGGWCYNKIDDNETEPSPYNWTETLSYLHVVSNVKDLLNVERITNGDIYYVANLSDYIEFTEEDLYSHFFVMEDDYNPERFSSWTNLNLEENFYEDSVDYSEEEVERYTDYAKKALYLDSIIPYALGNNPHVGYGLYDMGQEYIEYMKKPFKHSIDTKDFQTIEDIEDADSIEFEFECDGKPIKCPYKIGKKDPNENCDECDNGCESIKNDKIQIFADAVNRRTISDYCEFKTLPYGEYDLEDIKQLYKDKYFINSKVIRLRNKVENDQYRTYFRSVIIKYLLQLIPSTAIFVLENFALTGEKPQPSTKVRVHFLDTDGTTQLYGYKIERGSTVSNPDGSSWYLRGTSSSQIVTFPYTVNSETYFIKYVIPTYNVRFFENETAREPLYVQVVEEGQQATNPEEGINWYDKSDSTKTQVTFPYSVTENVDFVKLVKYTIKWYDNADDNNPTIQEIVRDETIRPLEPNELYYRKGDDTFTPVTFPITANQDEEFVKITTCTVRWYQSEEDQNPRSQQVVYGTTIENGGGNNWYDKSDSTKTQVTFPYRVTHDVDFVKLVEYVVNFYEDEEMTHLVRTETVTRGDTIDASGQWYMFGDPNKTPVEFPYTVRGNTYFIKYTQYIVNWVDNGETIDVTDYFSIVFYDSDGTTEIQHTVVGRGTSVDKPNGYDYYRKGDNSQTIVSFPITASKDEEFVRYVAPTPIRIVRFFENETDTEPVRVEPVLDGNTVDAEGYWYVKGDPNKTEVTFPYRITGGDVSFVNSHITVRWYDVEDDTQYYTAAFYDSDGTTLISTRTVASGTQINAPDNKQYYLKDDTTHAIVVFPYTVTANVSFVRKPEENYVFEFDDGTTTKNIAVDYYSEAIIQNVVSKLGDNVQPFTEEHYDIVPSGTWLKTVTVANAYNYVKATMTSNLNTSSPQNRTFTVKLTQNGSGKTLLLNVTQRKPDIGLVFNMPPVKYNDTQVLLSIDSVTTYNDGETDVPDGTNVLIGYGDGNRRLGRLSDVSYHQYLRVTVTVQDGYKVVPDNSDRIVYAEANSLGVAHFPFLVSQDGRTLTSLTPDMYGGQYYIYFGGFADGYLLTQGTIQPI